MKAEIAAPKTTGLKMRIFPAALWVAVAFTALLITFGNAALARFVAEAEQSLGDADLDRTVYGSGSMLDVPVSWLSACLTEGMRTQKALRLRQLDLTFGKESLLVTQQRLERAHIFLRNYAGCNPSDGSGWLGAAMVMKTMNNDADIIMQYLALSKYYTPNNRNAVKVRQEIARDISERLRSQYSDIILDAPKTAQDPLPRTP